MSDEEQSDAEYQAREDTPPPAAEKVEKKSFAPPQEHHFGEDAGPSEAQLRMEAAMKKRRENADEEWAEYEEIRTAERAKLEEEISELRQRREKRKQERAEEEKRLNEQRAAEEQKRRAEEDERQRKKREEEDKKREKREKERKDAEERSKVGGPNFTIVKKDGVPVPAGAEGDDQSAAVPQKSREQLEAEKRAALEQRCKPLNIDGLGQSQLQEKAKELFERLKKLESDKYDHQKRFEQQNFDMMELTEKARQMNKGGKKSNVQSQQNDPLASKMSGIPAKIVMYSLYERVTDPRMFGERRECYSGPSYKEEFIRIEPENKIEMTEMGAKIVGQLDGHQENHADVQVEE